MSQQQLDKTVSVVICTYNGGKYLREQMDSILAQTYPIHEIIVQDDRSTDDTVDIVRDYMAHHDNVHLYVNETNLGFNRNFETATMRATSDYVAISDQDDIWYPTKIEKQVATIGTHDICFCCHERGREREHSVYVTPQYSLLALLFNGFAGHTMLLQREFAQNTNNWIDYIHYDWSLAINAQLANGIVRINEPLNWHRTHSESAIASEQRRFGKSFNKRLTYQPYLYGWRNYRALQRKPNWKQLYTYIYGATTDQRHATAHTMCGLMLNNSALSLLRLCTICMHHRSEIYYNSSANGIKGKVRGFFYPFIFAYNNVQYDL